MDVICFVCGYGGYGGNYCYVKGNCVYGQLDVGGIWWCYGGEEGWQYGCDSCVDVL